MAIPNATKTANTEFRMQMTAPNFLTSSSKPLVVPYMNSLTPAVNNFNRPATLVTYSLNTTSVSSPGYYAKKKVRVQWISKKGPLKPPPPLRRFNPPTLPSFNIYKTKKPLSPLKTAQKFKRFKRRFELAVARRKAYIARWNIYYERYQKRLLRYQQLLELSKNGYMKIMRYRRVKQDPMPDNPYSRIQTIDTGWNGSFWSAVGCSYSGYPPITYGPGPYLGFGMDKKIWKNCPNHPQAPRTTYTGDPSVLYHLQPTTNAFNLADISARRKLLDKLGDSQKVHVGNMLAERAQTIMMLRDILFRLLNFFKSPKVLLNYIFSSGVSKRIGNDFLAFKFGLEPLINDAYELSKALRQTSSTDLIVIKAGNHVIRRDSIRVKDPTFGIRSDKTSFVTEEVSVHYVVRYRIDNAALHTMNNFGLVNPAEVLWEVMPWSFVIDWFLPIGNYIQSLNSDAGLTFVSGTKTVITKRSLFTTINWDQDWYKVNATQWAVERGNVSRTTTTISKVRTVLTAPPLIPLPSFKNPFSVTHLLESLALIRQRFR